MRERRPDAAEGPVLIAIDHLFVGSESDGLAQAVYDALGALDAAWPAAIAPLGAADLAALVDAARAAPRAAQPAGRERAALQGAVRRVGHVLERTPRTEEARRPSRRFVTGGGRPAVDPGQDGGTLSTLGLDSR
jgi:hypothetical protein